MRNYEREKNDRVNFIRNVIASANVDGIIFANSGGKDAALVGILCKLACDNTVGIALPCGVSRNYESDLEDAFILSQQYGIKIETISLTAIREQLTQTINPASQLTEIAVGYLAPRLRMITLYAIANSENRLVAGTSNRSEIYTGYSTKWGDGAYDFNPIADLTATEVLDFLRYLHAPESIIEKAPSAGLFEGQTDEAEMGVTYASLDSYILTGQASTKDAAIIDKLHRASEHKRRSAKMYGQEERKR